MLNENAKKWVAALRSGKYQQATGWLRSDAGFCCLGVACDIFLRERGLFWDEAEGFHSEDDQILPGNVMKWLGLAHDQGRYGPPTENSMLTVDNDEKDKSFSQIAEIIESEPEGLFVK